MAEAFLLQQFVELQCPQDLSMALTQVRQEAQARVFNVIRHTPIRPQRKHLRYKLEASPVAKPAVQDKRTRDQLQHEFIEKTRSTQQLTRRLQREQAAIHSRTLLRQQREVERLQKLKWQQEREVEEAQMVKAELMKRSLTEKRERRLKQHEIVINTIRHGHSNYKNLLDTVPLYKRMEDEYARQKEQSQLLKRKETLARKRQFLIYAPSQSTEPKLDSSRSYPKSRFHHILESEQAMEHRAVEEAEVQRKARQDRQRKYSRLVKDIFQPVASPKKQRELSEKIHRLHNPRPQFVPSNKPFHRKPLKRLPLKLDMTPKVFQRDYLQELKREVSPTYDWEGIAHSSLTGDVRARKLRKLASEIESKALRTEARLAGVNLVNSKILRTSEEASQLMIDSIKAKLAVFDERSHSVTK